MNPLQFSEAVNREMGARFGLKFRDEAELSQATKFLHENGLMLHYDDATLRDLYFLDPQWLCDVLSHVVTIREINPFAKNGIMRLEDLRHVFKSSSEISSYRFQTCIGLPLSTSAPRGEGVQKSADFADKQS